jgi:hypothetical protein
MSDATKNVAENVPRLILFAMLVSVFSSPCESEMAANPAITVEETHESIKVLINGILHMRIDRQCLRNVHSWHVGKRKFFIEYTQTGVSLNMVGEYDDEQMWIAILKELDRILT